MADYVRWLRERVGHAPVQLNFVGAAIVIDGKILLQRRSDDGSWGFPGGAIELDESAEMALIREVDEDHLLPLHRPGRHSPIDRQ